MTTSLSPEDVAVYPRPGMGIPGALAFSPDDRWITYLFSPAHSLTRQLFAYNAQTAEHHLIYAANGGGETEETFSVEEKLRRERARTRTLGVTHYAWMPGTPPDTICIMIPLNGSVYVLDDFETTPRLVVSNAEGLALDPRWSPDGVSIAFVRNAELTIANAVSGEQHQLTTGARETNRVHGLAEYISQEEMGRQHGFWWSPDSQLIAFTEVDETHIPVYRIVHQGKATTGNRAQEDHLYPFAGQENAKVRLGVIGVAGGNPVWMALGDDPDIYLARVKWWPDGTLVAQVENRAQNEVQVQRCDPATGQCRLLLKETNLVWINLHTMLRSLRDGRFIWASERTGFMHLYLYDQAGKLIHPLTAGTWMVDSLVGVDEVRERVYFMGTHDSVLERHLYVVSLSGGQPQRLTAAPGFHEVRIDHAKRCFLDTFSTPAEPPQVTLHALDDGASLGRVYEQHLSAGVASHLLPPEYMECQSPDGVIMHGMLYRPPTTYGDGPYPTIISVYGGPHVQQVTRSWSATVDLRAQYLSRLGYLVFKLDNRGSARRGQVFEGMIKHNMGDVEVQDQVTGVQWLVAQGLADPSRVGIYGWSYGGYMALMCLARAPEVFQVAVAGAPVTHWDGYDTHYTERYMGMPQINPDGYHSSSVMTHVDAIEGKLLLIHGLIDENVHFRHTARLVNALIRAGKSYDLLLFPDERHMPRRLEDRVYLETRLCDYFQAHL
jgi:dipeptidyl-peptidase-4